MAKHNWLLTKSKDYRERPAWYCPDCGAVCLVREDGFKQLLDAKGCNQINRDFDEIYHIVYDSGFGDVEFFTSMTLVGALECASLGCKRNYPDVRIQKNGSHDVEFDICLLIE